MVDLALLSHSSISIPILSISARPLRVPSGNGNFTFSFLNLKTQPLISEKARGFLVFAEKNTGLNEQKEEDEHDQEIGSKGDNNSGQDRPPIFNIRWSSLLAPDPDNILALGFTSLLTWASVQVSVTLGSIDRNDRPFWCGVAYPSVKTNRNMTPVDGHGGLRLSGG